MGTGALACSLPFSNIYGMFTKEDTLWLGKIGEVEAGQWLSGLVGTERVLGGRPGGWRLESDFGILLVSLRIGMLLSCDGCRLSPLS